MAADKYVNQIQLKHNSNGSHHWIEAYHPDFGLGNVPVGELSWSKKTGEITNVGVDKDYRKGGIGRRMYEEAHNYDPKPLHSKNKTKDGIKWAKKVGGPSVDG
jgi:GNAT superfamily N-acetyltransferase